MVLQITANAGLYAKTDDVQSAVYFEKDGHEHIEANISPPLFDWVIENLLKNALDAMEGQRKYRG